MKVAVLGAGSVGSALADACRRVGHDVAVGLRRPDDERHAEVLGRTKVADAVAGADLVVLAVPAGALAELLADLPLAPGTVLVDATNAVGTPPPGGAATVGAFVRDLVDPSVAVVKAFDTIGAEHMRDGRVAGTPAFLPIAGDPAGVDVVADLARAIGFDAVVLGGPEAFGLVEDHARLWIHLMRTGWGRDFGFGVLGSPNRAGQR